MTWTTDRIEEIKVSVTKDGQIQLVQPDAVGNEPAIIHVSPLQLAQLVSHLHSAALELAPNQTHKPGMCERCGDREPHGLLQLHWAQGFAGEAADAFGIEICQRCAPLFFDQWEALALGNTTPEEESPVPTSAQPEKERRPPLRAAPKPKPE